MINKKYILATGLALTLCMMGLAGCGSKDNNNVAQNNETETTTIAETTVAPSTENVTTTEADTKPVVLGDGSYSCSTTNDGLKIEYKASEGSDTVSSYEWKTSLPPDYEENKHSKPMISFYDANHGALFASLGSGAGSTYYTIYTTTDGGHTWKKQIDNFKMTNTPNQILYTSTDTLVVLDSGIGISVPGISVFHIDASNATQVCNQKHLEDIPDMVNNISMKAVDDSHISLEYVPIDSKQTKTVTIALGSLID